MRAQMLANYRGGVKREKTKQKNTAEMLWRGAVAASPLD
jgi:hypothetical protein